MQKPLEYETKGPITYITLNRPKSNALDRESAEYLLECLKIAKTDSQCQGLVLTGSGRFFSTGFDLKSIDLDRPETSVANLRDVANPLVQTLYSFPKPTVAVVNGDCAGLGMMMALACDTVYAASNVKFHMTFRKIGLEPACGATHIVPERVGASVAEQYFDDTISLPSISALDAGLIESVGSYTMLMESAARAALYISDGRSEQATAKKAMRDPDALQAAMDLEVELNAMAFASDKFRHAVEFIRACRR